MGHWEEHTISNDPIPQLAYVNAWEARVEECHAAVTAFVKAHHTVSETRATDDGILTTYGLAFLIRPSHFNGQTTPGLRIRKIVPPGTSAMTVREYLHVVGALLRHDRPCVKGTTVEDSTGEPQLLVLYRLSRDEVRKEVRAALAGTKAE